MGENSGIQWTHHTFNPWVGCQRVSPGCENCYAEVYDRRVGGGFVDGTKHLRWGPKAPRTKTSEGYWKKPLKWNALAKAAGERHRVFCASLADVFEDRPELDAWRRELFDLVDATPSLDWLLLTKRPENIARLMPEPAVGKRIALFTGELVRHNVWLGTTVEDQQRAIERVPHLVRQPAVCRFLSCEPLLEAVDLGRWLDEDQNGFVCDIDWVIVGGESGGKARPFALSWAESIIGQCRDAGRGDPRPFVKQLGSNPVVITGATGNFRTEAGRRQVELTGVTFPQQDRHGGDPTEWPEALRVREFPEVTW